MKVFRFILLITAIAIVACGKGNEDVNKVVEVNSVAITPTGPITLAIGDEVTLTATIAPENATNKQVTWSSDNSSVATVTDGGVVRALAVGTAIITAQAEGQSAICRINVEESVVEVTSVTVAPEGPLTATVGDSITFTATVMPEDATDRVVTWTSSNPELASIDDNGVMSAIAAGHVTIIASAGTMSASVEVTIENVYVAVTDIITNVEGDLLKLHWGETFQLELSVVPENATEQTIDYSFLRYDNDLEEFYYVKESEYLTVSEDGLITVFECNENSVVGEMIVMSAGDYTEELPILISPNEEEPILPDGWIVDGNTATYNVGGIMDFNLEVTFENEVCKTVRFTTLTRESKAADIEAVFPESVLDAFTITGRGTVATIDLLLVAGCKEYFENLTMAEMFAAFGDNTSAILTNWTTSFSVTNLVTGNWDISRFDYFGDIRNQRHIDYLLLDMDRMGITESETEDPLLVPEACQLELLFNKVTGQCEKAYAYMCFSTPTGCQTFVSNYVKTGVTYTRDVAGGQGESVQITLHTISGNVFTGKMRTEIIEMTNDEIIGNVLNLCIK